MNEEKLPAMANKDRDLISEVTSSATIVRAHALAICVCTHDKVFKVSPALSFFSCCDSSVSINISDIVCAGAVCWYVVSRVAAMNGKSRLNVRLKKLPMCRSERRTLSEDGCIFTCEAIRLTVEEVKAHSFTLLAPFTFPKIAR